MGEKNFLNGKNGHTTGVPRSIFAKNAYKGQVTIFIIIGIVIVGIAALIYSFYPQIQTTLGFGAKSPTEFIQLCLEEEIQDNIKMISLQGGSMNPEHYFLYKDEKIEYLCYTNKDYTPCIMQQAFLKQHVEEELKVSIEEVSTECFEDLKKSYERRGYDTSLILGEIGVQLFPERVIVNFDHTLTLTKESSVRYKEFSIILDNNLYELVSIAKSILSFETRFGDSETTSYMNFYHDLKVEKKKHSDGTTIYILTNRDTLNKFQFASRSVVWPSGYGL
jgi:hypothetical protein